jgi:peptidoglycan glycosyltransferase
MNAQTGEILAMGSHPGFDANQLAQEWPNLIQDSQSPLLNRASQGQYSPGTALGPFLLAESNTLAFAPSLPESTNLSTRTNSYTCSYTPSGAPAWGTAVSAGCPAAQAALGKALGASRLTDLFRHLGFYDTPLARLPASAQPAPSAVKDLTEASIGQEGPTVSPLQMALAASSLTQDGLRPAPRIALSIQSPVQGWEVLPPLDQPARVYPSGSLGPTLDSIRPSGQPYWSAVGMADNGAGKKVAWFVGGTLPTWQGSPVALALALENGSAQDAQKIGSIVLQAAMK